MDRIAVNGAMHAGDTITSPSGRYWLTMQGDGNLVLYDHGTAPTSPFAWVNAGGTAFWASNTAGHSGAWLSVQGDGNLVVYDAGGGVLWSSVRDDGAAYGQGGELVIQDDGNVVYYDVDGNALFNTRQSNFDRASANTLGAKLGSAAGAIVSAVKDVGEFVKNNAALAAVIEGALAATGLGAIADVALDAAASATAIGASTIADLAGAGAEIVDQVEAGIADAQSAVAPALQSLQSIARQVPENQATGFHAGLALATQNLTNAQIWAARSALSPSDQVGFDLAFIAAGKPPVLKAPAPAPPSIIVTTGPIRTLPTKPTSTPSTPSAGSLALQALQKAAQLGDAQAAAALRPPPQVTSSAPSATSTPKKTTPATPAPRPSSASSASSEGGGGAIAAIGAAAAVALLLARK